MSEQQKQKVVIVGAGISGIMCAWRLQDTFEVVLLEARPRLGGHTNTITIPSGADQGAKVDTGFIVLNDRTYPTLHGFFKELGVKWRFSDMSFGFECASSGFQYAGTGFFGLFAQLHRLFSPAHWKFLREVLAFCKQGLKDLEQDTIPVEQSLDDYLKQHSFSDALIQQYVLPMGAAIWSTPAQTMLEFPALSFFRFCKHHGLLELNDRPKWQTVVGGSNTYVERFKEQFRGEFQLNETVSSIERSADSVTVSYQSESGSTHSITADHVVCALHGDRVLPILSDASDEEQEVFKEFAYQPNLAILHHDRRMLPSNTRAWASWNYRREKSDKGDAPLSVTYDMKRLQGLDTTHRYLVTLNTTETIEADKIVEKINYRHPLYTVGALRSQLKVPSLQGKNRTYFCGAYCGWGFHEDGAKSGANVAELLNNALDELAEG